MFEFLKKSKKDTDTIKQLLEETKNKTTNEELLKYVSEGKKTEKWMKSLSEEKNKKLIASCMMMEKVFKQIYGIDINPTFNLALVSFIIHTFIKKEKK